MEIYFHPKTFTGTVELVGKIIEEIFEEENPNDSLGLFYEDKCFVIIVEDDSFEIPNGVTSIISRIAKKINAKVSVISLPDYNFTEVLYN